MHQICERIDTIGCFLGDTGRLPGKEDAVSSRAWIFFLCLAGAVTAGAWTTASAHSAQSSLVSDARIVVDLENRVCRLQWLGGPDQEPSSQELAAVLKALESDRR